MVPSSFRRKLKVPCLMHDIIQIPNYIIVWDLYHEQFLSSSWIPRLQLICLILARIYKILTGSLVQSWAVIFWVDKQWSWVRFSLLTPNFFFFQKGLFGLKMKNFLVLLFFWVKFVKKNSNFLFKFYFWI